MKKMSVIEKLNTRAIFSRFSGSLVYFMDSLTNVEEYEKARAKGYKAFSDGLNLIDEKANVEDDIQQMYVLLKNWDYENLMDFYSENGFFGADSTVEDKLKALNKIQTKKVYIKRTNLNIEL